MSPPASRPAAAAAQPRFDQGLFLMHLNRARELVSSGRLAEAREQAEIALSLRPSDEATLNLLGLVYSRLDLRVQAARIYRDLLQLHPESDVLHANLGVLELKEGLEESARRRLETALLLNPANTRPHLYLALLERRQGNSQACLRHLQAAGARDLLERLGGTELEERAGSSRDRLADDADTGPMRAIVAAGRAEVGLLAEAVAARQASLQNGDGVRFEVQVDDRTGEQGSLLIEFDGEVLVRPGRALYLIESGGPVQTDDRPAGLERLRGRGRLMVMPPEGMGVLLMRLTRGVDLHLQAARLIAHGSGVCAAASRRRETLSGMMGEILAGALQLTGEGIVAVGATSRVRSETLGAGEALRVASSALVGWTGSLLTRPAAAPGAEALLMTGQFGSGALRLEGEGEALIDAPA